MGKTYVSPSGTAKELQKIYVGNSNNIAQEIKRAYIGDSNGIARMVFGSFDYTKIDYVQSTGSKWIDTGVIPTSKTKMEVKLEFTNTSTAGYNGSSSSSNSGRFYVGQTGSGKFRLALGTANDTVSSDTSAHIFVLDAKNHMIAIDNTTFSTSNEAIPTNSIYLLGNNTDGFPSYYPKEKLYYCKIWQDDVLVRNFIPVQRKADSREGLYDLINHTFYPLPRPSIVDYIGYQSSWSVVSSNLGLSGYTAHSPENKDGVANQYINTRLGYSVSYKYAGIYLNSTAIDLTPYTKVYTINMADHADLCSVNIINENSYTRVAYTTFNSTSKKAYELDISSLEGKYRICYLLTNPKNSKYSVNLKTYSVWLF